jgi:hypothetical protein
MDWFISTENTGCFDSIADNITISLTAGCTNNAVIGKNNTNQTATPTPMPNNVPLLHLQLWHQRLIEKQ